MCLFWPLFCVVNMEPQVCMRIFHMTNFFDENNNGSPAEFDIYTTTCGASDVMPNHRQRGKGPLLLHPGEGIEEEEEEVEGDRPRRFYHPSRRRRRRRRKGPRIVGGEGAEEGAWPWQVKKIPDNQYTIPLDFFFKSCLPFCLRNGMSCWGQQFACSLLYLPHFSFRSSFRDGIQFTVPF